jgi:hypothetical protein
MARKQFNFVVSGTAVVVQRLTYADPDAPAVVAEEKTFAVADVPAELTNGEGVVSLAAYGLSQVLQDRVSSCDADEKLEAMEKVFGNLVDGKWKEARQSTGATKKAAIDPFFAKGFSLFLQGQGKDVTAEQATIILQGLDADQRKALRTNDDIKAFIEKAKEEATASVADLDLSSLLG